MKNTIVSGALIENDKGEYLLLHYDKERDGGVYIPPGGKIELGESAREAAIRESKEELNIDIEIEELIGISEVDYGTDKHWIFLFYKATIKSGTPKIMEDDKVIKFGYYPKEYINYFSNIKWF